MSPTDRAALFSALPITGPEALALLRKLKAAGLVWHFDDDPRSIIGAPFSEAECAFLEKLVNRLNDLFRAYSSTPDVVNAGAWHAAGLVNWGDVEDVDAIAQPSHEAFTALLEACQQAEHWLAAELERPGEAKPDEILRVLRSAIVKASAAE